MDRDTSNAAIAAGVILLLFGLAAYFLPTIMLAERIAAGIAAS